MNAYETALALAVMARAGEDGTVDSFAQLDGSEEDFLPAKGYWVGGVRPSLIISDVAQLDRSELAWFVGSTDARYFGVWTDSESGDIFFDAVDHLDNEMDALVLADERNELAIWDIVNSREIRISDVLDVKPTQGAGDDV